MTSTVLIRPLSQLVLLSPKQQMSLIEWRLYTPSSLSTNPAGGSASIAPQSLPKQLPLNQNGTFRRGFVKNKNQCVRSQRLIPRKLFEVHHIPTEILRSQASLFEALWKPKHVRNRISIKKIDHRGLGYIKNRRRATRISAYVVGTLYMGKETLASNERHRSAISYFDQSSFLLKKSLKNRQVINFPLRFKPSTVLCGRNARGDP